MSSVVRPEFGPTLPELLGPRLRALPRAARVALALAVAALAIVASLVAVVVVSREDRHAVVVRGPLTFNLVYPDGLRRAPPGPGELLALRSPAGAGPEQRFTVRAIRVPAYRGDIGGFLPLHATSLIAAARRADPDFVLRGDGKARINDVPGYGYVFQTRSRGRTVYGRRLLLFPDEPGARLGADVLLLSERSPAVPRADSVGGSGPLKTALRSFRLGADRP